MPSRDKEALSLTGSRRGSTKAGVVGNADLVGDFHHPAPPWMYLKKNIARSGGVLSRKVRQLAIMACSEIPKAGPVSRTSALFAKTWRLSSSKLKTAIPAASFLHSCAPSLSATCAAGCSAATALPVFTDRQRFRVNSLVPSAIGL